MTRPYSKRRAYDWSLWGLIDSGHWQIDSCHWQLMTSDHEGTLPTQKLCKFLRLSCKPSTDHAGGVGLPSLRRASL
jgi:hypothetical protein